MQECTYEYLLLVAVAVLAATHQAYWHLLRLLQSAGFFLVFSLRTQEVEPIPHSRVVSVYMTCTSFAQSSYEALTAVCPAAACCCTPPGFS